MISITRNGQSINRALLRRAGVEANSLVDAGCGTGLMTVELARAGARVVGVDVSEGMLRAAAETPAARGRAGHARP